MRVIISVQSIRQPITGIGRYTLELAKHLKSSNEFDDILFDDGNTLLREIPDPNLTPAPTPKTHVIRNRLIYNKYTVGLYRLIANRFSLKAFRFLSKIKSSVNTYKKRSYLYHGTNFYTPSFSRKKIVTIHDISIITMPEFHPRERVVLLHDEIINSIKTANAIITDSHYIKSEIMEYFSLSGNNIHVATLSHSSNYQKRSETEIKSVMDKYSINYCGYSLYAGTIEPRKNIYNLIESYSKIDKEIRHKYPLILAGHKGWNNEDIMMRIKTAEEEGWLKYLGYIPEEDLPQLFSGARLFTFPSFYEGFGLPVLEAMASGVPVVSSDRASLPEVCGKAAILCDPNDVDALQMGLSKGLTDEEWRKNAITQGLEQAGTFSWEKCSRETIEIYKKYI